MCSKSSGVCACVCFKYFHSDAEVVLSWLLKLYRLLWSELRLSLPSTAWDVQKALNPGWSVRCPRAWPCVGYVPAPLQNHLRRDESLPHLPSFPRKAITAFSNFWWGASLLLPHAIVALLPKQGRSGKKLIRAGNDHDEEFIFSISGFV